MAGMARLERFELPTCWFVGTLTFPPPIATANQRTRPRPRNDGQNGRLPGVQNLSQSSCTFVTAARTFFHDLALARCLRLR